MNLILTKGFNENNFSAIKNIIQHVYINASDKAIKLFRPLKVNQNYLRRGHAEVFVVWRNKTPIATAVTYYDDYSATVYNNSGFFNFFESLNDPEAVEFLFLSIQEWLKNFTLKSLVGPMSPIMSEPRGLCIEDSRASSVFGMPHNPVYYAELLEKKGFTKLKDLFGLQVPFSFDKERLNKTSKYAMSKFKDMRVRNLDLNNIENEVRCIVNIYNEAWKNNWGFIPIEYKEFYDSVISMEQIVRPEHGVFIEINQKPVAFRLIIPDLNIAVSKSAKYNNKLIKNIVFMRSLKRTNQYRALFIGVLQQYRLLGLESILMKSALNLKIKSIHIGWVLEDNQSLQGVIRNLLGFEPGKKIYRLYKYSFV